MVAVLEEAEKEERGVVRAEKGVVRVEREVVREVVLKSYDWVEREAAAPLVQVERRAGRD